jgi:hypothetical protein
MTLTLKRDELEKLIREQLRQRGHTFVTESVDINFVGGHGERYFDVAAVIEIAVVEKGAW